MYATVRRYEGIDDVRPEEVTKKVGESLLPSLSKLPGFGGYYLIDAGEGVFTSVGLFENRSRPTSRRASPHGGCVNRSSSQRFRRRRSPRDQ